MILISGLQKPIDAFVPSVGHLYRVLRDHYGAERVAIRTEYGFALAGDPEMARDYEPAEVNTFLKLLDSCATVVDIGANIGFYSCLAASHGKHVVSFEPLPRNLQFLYRNLWENEFRSTEVFPIGLAKEPGLKRLYGFAGLASFVPGWGGANKAHFAVVPVTSLDTILAGRFNGQQLLIKIDVEGFELDVLAGAENTLSLTPRPTWLVETALNGEQVPAGINAQFVEVFETFWRHGYEARRLTVKRESVRRADVHRWVANGAVEIDSITPLSRVRALEETQNFLFSHP
jgi:FkbM family methyltransferase